MKLTFILLILFLMSCSHKPLMSPTTAKAGEDWTKMWVQNGCFLYNFERKLKSYPGDLCIFLEDGSFLSANGNSLKRFSPTREIMWEVQGHFHHQLNLTPDKKRILALSSEVRNQNKKKVRDDVFLIFDLNGKLLHKRLALSLLRETGKAELDWPKKNLDKTILDIDVESSHFNSIYEIPLNAYSKSVHWLKEGNIIVNSYGLGIYILSPDLSRLLKFSTLQPEDQTFHDVQVSSDGNFLYFNNVTYNPENIRFSTIQKYDPVKEKITMEFRANPKELFYSAACGSVQEIGDLFFFSHITAGGFLWSSARNEILLSVPGSNDNPKSIDLILHLKLIDPEMFFKNSK